MYSEPDNNAPGWVPFQRWRQAEAVLLEAERRHAPAAELVALSNAVITARVSLIKARISDGWLPTQEALNQLERDEILLKQGEGLIAKFDPQPADATTS